MTLRADSDTGLNENHVRHVVSTFRYMDDLLVKAEQIMASAGAPSPFQQYADDTTPLQRKVTHDYVMRLREMMSRQLEELHIPRPAPVTGALWAARSAVTFADIALAEMESKRMSGYGKLSAAAAQKVDAIVAELRAAIERLNDYLAQSVGTDLSARLQRLESTSNEAPLLREMERIITAHGLVEFRNAVTMLVERMENGAFEIGVFGRVSSGKSSLLNHLLGGAYLPVGVTPVTAVPTRISYGERPQVRVEFADSRPEVVELSALADFATEQQNPGNVKHVARLHLQLPSATLRAGITFVDTPGLGSLATRGAEETVGYLPRCDLGLVLVDAASTLTHEDLKVIHAVYQAGATAMVLVSKADLLNPADRKRALDYVRAQVRAEVGTEPPVYPVSVVGAETRLCDEWFESQLRPLLAAHRELAAASLKRKIGGLREALLVTLQHRVETGSPAISGTEMARLRDVEQQLRGIPQMLETTRREAEERARNLRDAERLIIEIAADELAAECRSREAKDLDLAQTVSSTVVRLITEETTKVRQRVEQTRNALAGLFQEAARAFPSVTSALQELPPPAGLPLPEVSAVAGGLTLHRPAVLALFGRTVLRRHFQARLRNQLNSELHNALTEYSRRLAEWARQTFAGLEAGFTANAGLFEAQWARQKPSSPTSADDDGALRNDLLLLSRWGQAEAAQRQTVT